MTERVYTVILSITSLYGKAYPPPKWGTSRIMVINIETELDNNTPISPFHHKFRIENDEHFMIFNIDLGWKGVVSFFMVVDPALHEFF